MTQLFVFGLASLYGQIQIDYSAPKRIFGTALISASLENLSVPALIPGHCTVVNTP